MKKRMSAADAETAAEDAMEGKEEPGAKGRRRVKPKKGVHVVKKKTKRG